MKRLSRGLSDQDLHDLWSGIHESSIVAITDKRGIITYVNQQFCEISQYSEEELLGKTHKIVNSDFHPPEFFKDMWKTIITGENWRGEIRNRAKDGSFYWVHTSIVPFFGADDKPERYVAVRSDITSRKIYEEQLKVLSAKLAEDVEELKNTRAKVIQQDRLASIGLLASSLAHEIGTPMGIIRSRAELVAKKLRTEPALKENVDIIVGQIDRIAKLVNSLLHLARTKPTENAVAVNLNDVVRSVLALVQHELDRKSINLVTDLQNDFTVKAESGSLGQVLLNLFVNSVHAIEDAKQKLGRNNSEIRLRSYESGKKIVIEIHDNGCGISKENLDHLFTPFFTTKDVGVGTGLGLAISYNLVNSWGGTLGASSELDKGTVFTIELNKP